MRTSPICDTCPLYYTTMGTKSKNVVAKVQKGERNVATMLSKNLLGLRDYPVVLMVMIGDVLWGVIDGPVKHNSVPDRGGQRQSGTHKRVKWWQFTQAFFNKKMRGRVTRGRTAYDRLHSLTETLYVLWKETNGTLTNIREMGTSVKDWLATSSDYDNSTEGLSALRELLIGSGIAMYPSKGWGAGEDTRQTDLTKWIAEGIALSDITQNKELMTLFEQIDEEVWEPSFEYLSARAVENIVLEDI